MKTDRDRYLITLTDGSTLRRGDYTGHITEVAVPYGGKRRCLGNGLRRDQDALIFSVLVVPRSNLLTEIDDLGTLVFDYNDKPQLVAPVRGLMNRYAGLTKLAQLQQRLRLAGILLAGMDEWDRDVAFAHPLVEPVHVQENLEFFLRHIPPDGPVDPTPPYVVEIQAVIKDHTGERDFFRWESLP